MCLIKILAFRTIYVYVTNRRLCFFMQDLPPLHPRGHDGFQEMQYDDRYTPFRERAGLDVISFQVCRGLPPFNHVALTALVDRYYL
jgi:hypothetical protein